MVQRQMVCHLSRAGALAKNDLGRFNVSSDPIGNVFVVAAVVVVVAVPYCVHHPIVQRTNHSIDRVWNTEMGFGCSPFKFPKSLLRIFSSQLDTTNSGKPLSIRLLCHKRQAVEEMTNFSVDNITFVKTMNSMSPLSAQEVE
jgi:hypothetical protein